MTSLLELSWAAGLFDGDGHAYAHDGCYPTVALAQSESPLVLERFRDAVGGRGKVYGPYTNDKREGRKPRYVYRTTSAREGSIVMSLIAPYVSVFKARQIDEALEAYRSRNERGIATAYSEEHRAKQSAARRGAHHTAEAREKIAAAHRGKPKSPEHRAALRRAWVVRKGGVAP